MALQLSRWADPIAVANQNAINAEQQAAIDNYGNAIKQNQQGLSALEAADPKASTDLMRGYSQSIAQTAAKLPQYAKTVSGYGETMATSGNALATQGNNLGGIANDILNMNADSDSAYVQALLGLYGKYDPENQVSLAVQDVNNQFDTGEGTLLRNLTRQGVSAGSGRSSTLQQQYQISRNTALAAAATRARLSGLDKQASAFNSLITGSANTLLGQQKDFATSAASVLSNAVNAQNTAASIEANSAALFGTAATVESNAANLDLGYASKIAAQNNTIANSYQALGGLYDAQASRELNAMLNAPTTTISTTTTASDEYDPWESTGHDSTYWKNTLSTEDYANLASQMAAASAAVEVAAQKSGKQNT